MGYNGCKHAVAVVAEYLLALADERSVPVVASDDPQWTQLGGADESLEDVEDGVDEFGLSEDEEGKVPGTPGRHRSKRKSRESWGTQIRHLIDRQIRGLRQVSESHDEGETGMAFAECLPIVLEPVG